MCGIGGILSLTGAPAPRAPLESINQAQRHRGPDGAGIHLDGPCGLAHRRLAIIDLSESAVQPMPSIDQRYWLCFNGEIYNYLELRSELIARGARFRTVSDSEVILEAYRAYGLDAFAKLNGMWALAIWDAEARQLILSRDRFGKKPLYLHQNAERLLFASEVKALLAAEPALAVPNPRFIAGFLEVPWVGIGAETPIAGVERFPAATTRVIGPGGAVRDHHYWTFVPPSAPSRIHFADATAEVRALLTDAVRLRFRSDVPVGTCLSGGLDSSSIVALSAHELGKAPKTFSAIYEVPGFEEGEFIDQMNQQFSLDAFPVRPDGRDLEDTFTRIAYYQDEPSAGPGLYSQWHVMKTAAPEVKVLLDGQGGDEVFAGYFPQFTQYMEVLLRRAAGLDIQAGLLALRAGPKIGRLTGSDPLRAQLRRQALKRVPARARRLFQHLRSGPAPAPPLLGAALQSARQSRAGWAAARPTEDALTNVLWDQLVRTSVPGLLHYEDRDSMAFSIEARVPFLDYRLVEYVFSLPTEHKIHEDMTKRILREAMRGILPEKIRTRRDKKGYPTPFGNWIREPRHEAWARELLFGSRAAARGFVNPEAAQRFWAEHQRGSADHAWRLWQLMSVEAFARRFFDGPFLAE